MTQEKVIVIPANGWMPRPYQQKLWDYLEQGGKRAAVVWHRRAGKDLFAINRIAKSMIQRPGLYWHAFPTYNQGRKVIWDGFTKAGVKFLSAFPEELIKSKNDQMMRLELKNGAIYQIVGTDDPDNLVGPNPFGIVFSEWSIMNPRAWTLLRPILRENGGWACFIFTPRGRNHGYELFEKAKTRPGWFTQKLSVADTEKAINDYADRLLDEKLKAYWRTQVPITKEGIQEEREEGMSEEMIDQEFYVDFNAPLVGSYYGEYMRKAEDEGRIINVPYNPLLPIDTAWDLGMDDSTGIWFIQKHHTEIRIVDYYENSGEGLPHYANVVHKKCKGFMMGKHYLPHDVKVRELGSGKSRFETLKTLGIKPTVVKRQEIADGVEAVRNILPRCYFDKVKTAHGVQALKEYRKEYDEQNRVFLNKPVHDWTSHGCDAMRTYAMAFKEEKTGKKEKKQDTAEGGFSIW